MTTETTPRPSFGRRVLRAFGWLLRFLLRLIFVIIIGALVGGGIYFGATYGISALNQAIFQPVHEHTLRLNELEIQTSYANEQMNQRLQALQERVDTLTKNGDTTRETLSSLQTRLETSAAALSDVQNTLDEVQSAVNQIQTDQEGVLPRVTELETSLGELDTALTTSLDALDEALNALSETVSQTVDDVAALTAKVDDDSALVAVQTDIQLLKAMEMLTRARLLLAQNNPGLAEAEGRAARDILLALQATVPDFQARVLTTIIQRLESGLDNLPAATRLASDEFEIAWQLLARGLPVAPGSEPLLSPLPVPEPPLTSSDTLSPTGTITTTVEITGTEGITATEVVTPTTP